MRSKRRSMVETPVKRKLPKLRCSARPSPQRRLNGVFSDTSDTNATSVWLDLKRAGLRRSLDQPQNLCSHTSLDDSVAKARGSSPVHRSVAAVLSIAGNHHFK